MSAEVRNANMLSGGPPKKTTRTYFGKVKMAVSRLMADLDPLTSPLTGCSANFAAVEGQNVYPLRALHVRDA